MEAVELARISLNFRYSQVEQWGNTSPHFLFSLPNESLQAKSGTVKWPLREKSRQKKLNWQCFLQWYIAVWFWLSAQN